MEANIMLYANRLEIDLYEEYGATKAAELCRVGVGAIRAAKKNNEIGYIAVGETQYRFLGWDLVIWKLKKRVTASETTISPGTGKDTIVGLGTMNAPSKESQQACALQALRKQKHG